MRNHPLTPMTDSNLVRHLQVQTETRVGLLAKHDIDAHRIAPRLEQLRNKGIGIALLDCTSDADLEALSEAIADLPLITGSSAPAIHLPQVWRRKGLLPQQTEGSTDPLTKPSPYCGTGFLAVAGSCSEATRRQNARALDAGFRHFPLDAGRLLQEEEPLTAIIQNVAAALAQDDNCLLSISAEPENVRRVQALAARRGMNAAQSGLRIARRLAALVRAIFEVREPAALLTAGGETSSAVCRALELGALQVGRNLEPGVPLCRSLGHFQIPVVLKSGNFGSDSFYSKAMSAARAPGEVR